MDKLDCILDSCEALNARMDALELESAREELSRGDDFNEADHPRASDGKFGGGGGGEGIRRSPEAVMKTIGHLETLARHPNTPEHEAAAARNRIAALKERYGSEIGGKSGFSGAASKSNYDPSIKEPHLGNVVTRKGAPHSNYHGPNKEMISAQAKKVEAFNKYKKNKNKENRKKFDEATVEWFRELEKDQHRYKHG